MHFSTPLILSILSLTAFTAAYHIDNPSASLRLRDLQVRDLYQSDLSERSFNEDLSIRTPDDDDLFARALYADGFLHARSLYGRAKASAKDAATAAAATSKHLKTLREDLASAKSALHTMQTNPLQAPDGLQENRLKMKIMNLQGEIMAANGGALK